MDSEPQLTKPTQNPDRVKNYMKSDKVSEPVARKLTALNLWLERTKKRADKYEKMATMDSLTNLPNRWALLGDPNVDPPISGYLDWALAHTRRSGEKLSIIMFDLDHLKTINDESSDHHSSGDRALREISKVLKKAIRESDYPDRYAGDEFVVVLQNTNIDGAKILAEKLRSKINEQSQLTPKITISGGIVEYDPQIHKSSGELVQAADKLLYQAKKRGRNRIEFKLSNENIDSTIE